MNYLSRAIAVVYLFVIAVLFTWNIGKTGSCGEALTALGAWMGWLVVAVAVSIGWSAGHEQASKE